MMNNAQPGAGQRQAQHVAEAAATRRPRGASIFAIERPQDHPDFEKAMNVIRKQNSALMQWAANFDKEHPDGY